MRILLIEDNKDYAETLSDIFSDAGVSQFEWVKTLDQVESALKKKKWDIILSDVHLDFLPEQILNIYRSSLNNKNVPFIFLTAEPETRLAYELTQSIQIPIVSKFDVDDDLLMVVKNFIDIYSLISEHESVNEENAFKQYIIRHINGRKYEKEGLFQSISSWMDIEKSVISRIGSSNDSIETYFEQNIDTFNSGYLIINSETLAIKQASHSFDWLTEDGGDIIGERVDSVLGQIMEVERLLSLLDKIKSISDREVNLTNSKGINDWKKSYFKISIKSIKSDVEGELDFALEIFLDLNYVQKVEFINLKQTNELLTQEIHHRVNNNLSLITSLINIHHLSSESREEKVYAKVLNQITAISSVYEQLFESNRIVSVSLTKYLNKFYRKLFHSSMCKNGFEEVITDNPNLRLNINQAIPLGLLLNDLYERFNKNVCNLKLFVQEKEDLITIKIESKGIGEVYKKSEVHEHLMIAALLSRLQALISPLGDDIIQLRFKKKRERGAGSNLYD